MNFDIRIDRPIVSLNSIPIRNYIQVKEAKPELPYRNGPIFINEEDSFWVLTSVINMCPDEKVVDEDVRVSINIKRNSDKETIVESTIICPDAEPKRVSQSINFVSDKSFEIVYAINSAYAHSEYYGLHSLKRMPLDDDIMTENDTRIGFWDIDGRVPGENNAVTVSVKLIVNVEKEDKYEISAKDIVDTSGKIFNDELTNK